MMKKREIYHIEGLQCSGCSGTVQSALMQADGVKDARVDHVKGVAEVTHSLDEHQIAEIVNGAGYRFVGKEKA